MANQNKQAATSWKTGLQTPCIFYPDLAAKPWWNAQEFPTAVAMEKSYAANKEKILSELQAVKDLQERLLQGHQDAEVNMQGEIVEPETGLNNCAGKGA